LKNNAKRFAELFKNLTRTNFIVRIPSDAHRLLHMHDLLIMAPTLPLIKTSEEKNYPSETKSARHVIYTRDRKSHLLSAAGFTVINNFTKSSKPDKSNTTLNTKEPVVLPTIYKVFKSKA
jgi:hypothetical protein